MPTKALITGITGQDGSYLAEFLLQKGYEVHGLVRRIASESLEHRFSRILPLVLQKRIVIHSGDLMSPPKLSRLVRELQPHELYHLGAQSQIGASFDDPHSTFAINADSVHFLLEAIREFSPHTRLFFAGTSEFFGEPDHSPQNEITPFRPRSPYAIAKAAGHHWVRTYRELHNLHASTGIMYAHESPRRGYDFFTRKATMGIARIVRGLQGTLSVGNLDSVKDWGFSGDYVRAMWLMLQQDMPDDYVLGSGEAHTVREFLMRAFAMVEISQWESRVVVDQAFVRPVERMPLVADITKIKTKLGWVPTTSFEDLVRMMIRRDLELISS